MTGTKRGNTFVYTIVLVVAAWLIGRLAMFLPVGWAALVTGIVFFLVLIGSLFFLFRLAKNIGKSDSSG